MLSNVCDIKPPAIMAHLDSPERIAREALKGLEQPSALVKYFDPLTFEMLLNPNKYQLQSEFFCQFKRINHFCTNIAQ
jgi:hypothetical protein